MASAQPAVKRGGKRHFLFLPPPKPPEWMVFDESGVAAAGVDFDPAPWPTEPTYWNIVCDYIREHAIPSRCKWRSSFTILLRGTFIFEEGLTRPASSFKRADGLHYITARRADGVKDGSIRRELAIIYAAFRHALQWERIQKAPIFPKPPTSPARLRWRMQLGFSAELIGALIADDPDTIRGTYGHLAPDHLRGVANMDVSTLRVERREAA